ncbi:F0F1 ATP synthase subunit delta [Paenibacillus eucommiae]|uniref:ATP synthase subunit delta n=1 Tax=Paenibacillus eucommiae TaxID=1355755 RepID=A0ABS4IZU3_9BACL|nr:F0F1 ATP synthase subunit delta [Paenibacillus eucommiae]MBP1992590.1 F-type H+-transporting ATPase subunit delta [Paenibacillus eucommiae]
MSADIVVAKRYAKALFEVAREKSLVTEIEEELRSIVKVIEENADLGKLLNHPNITTSAKIDLLKKLFEGNVSDVLFNTLQLLFSRGREALLPQLLIDYIRIVNDALGRATAIVKTPFALSESSQQTAAAQFSKVTGKTIRVENVVDPALIGGMQVRIGDRLYDGSLLGKLDRFEKFLSNA